MSFNPVNNKADLAKKDLVQLIAEDVRSSITLMSDKYGVSVCEIEAEILSQCLMSDDCDKCHVHWLEFQSSLESKLKEKGTIYEEPVTTNN